MKIINGENKIRKSLYIAFAIFCLLLVVEKTLLRTPMTVRIIKLNPIWKFIDTFKANKILNSDVKNNILLFIPFGAAVTLLIHDADKVILTGFLTSSSIEIIQLMFKLGWFETEDILDNTIGTAMGWIVASLLLLVIRCIREKICIKK